jgi:hypothetical protein
MRANKDSAFEASSADAVREGEHIAYSVGTSAEPPGGIHALFKGPGPNRGSMMSIIMA